MSGQPPSSPSPAALLRQHGLSAKKSWGQCFLHDPGVVRRIVEAVAPREGETVVEIGAGLGVLTEALAADGRCGKVVAVERDRDMVQVLNQRLGQEPRIELREANALTLDLSPFGQRVSVVGNLPYNISSPLLFHLLAQPAHIRAATLMFQKELAQRIAAGPGGKRYGVPSVLCRLVARVRHCFDVPRGCFFPPPRVDSAVVQLEFDAEPGSAVRYEHTARVVKVAFGARRKTLRKALSRAYDRQAVDAALATVGIDPARRAETLTVEEFVALAAQLEETWEGAPST